MRANTFIRCFPATVAAVFLVSFLLPFMAVYTVPDAGDGTRDIASVFGKNTLLSTADGFRWTRTEALHAHHHHTHAPHSQHKCAMCFVATYGIKDVSLSVPEAWTAALTIASFTPHFSCKRSVRMHPLRHAWNSRAPPALWIT